MEETIATRYYSAYAVSRGEACLVGGGERSSVTWLRGGARLAVGVLRRGYGGPWAVRVPGFLARGSVRPAGSACVGRTAGAGACCRRSSCRAPSQPSPRRPRGESSRLARPQRAHGCPAVFRDSCCV